MANLAAAGSAQGLMQSRSGEYVNQDLQRQKLAQETKKPIDDYLNKKQEKAKNEEQEISKFIEFKDPVLPKDEEDRLAEASSIVKMIKDKADRKEIEMAKLKFYSNDLDRVSQRKRSDNDINLAMLKPDEYKITGNVYSPTSKAEYKAKFGTDKYDTSHAIGENYVGDDTEWIIKKMPSFKEQSSKGLNKSETVEGTSFADEDTRMMWESSTINQMLDGVTPQSKSFLKKATKEVLDADPELQYYPEELDAVVKQVASGKILSVWDSQKQSKTIDNNAPIGGKGLEINNNLGNGGIETPDGVFIPKETPLMSDEQFNQKWKQKQGEYYNNWLTKYDELNPKSAATDVEKLAMFNKEVDKPSANNPKLTINEWNKQQLKKEADNAKKGLTAISFTPKGKDNWFEATASDGKIRKIIPKTIYKNDKGELVKVEGYNVDESTGDIKIDLEEFEVDTKNEDNRNSFIGKYPTTIRSVGLNVPTKVVVSGKQGVGTIQGKGAEKTQPKDYGTRPDGTKKGKGYFGELKMEDGSGSVATEISMNFDDVLGGALIPSLVPTLTESEKKHLLKGNKATKEIQLKAIKHAEERASKGLSPFVDGGELKSKSGKPIYWDKTAKTYKYK
jgi:hypothetical protein